MKSVKPSLRGPKGRQNVACICSFCAALFKGYKRWAERGYQDCPTCKLSGTGIVKIISREQILQMVAASND